MEISGKNDQSQKFILLINVKMPNCWHFNIYEQDKFTIVGILTFMSRINFWEWKKFYNLGALSHIKAELKKVILLSRKTRNDKKKLNDFDQWQWNVWD